MGQLHQRNSLVHVGLRGVLELFQSATDVLLLFPPFDGLLFVESSSDFPIQLIDIHGLQPLFKLLIVLLNFIDNFPVETPFVVVTLLEGRLDPV